MIQSTKPHFINTSLWFLQKPYMADSWHRKRNALVSALSVVCVPLPPRDQGTRSSRASSCCNSSDLSRLETKAGEALVFLEVPNTPSFSASPFVGKTFAPKMSDVGSLFENSRSFVQLGHTSALIFIIFKKIFITVLLFALLKHVQITILMIVQKLFCKSFWKVAKLDITIILEFKTLVKNHYSLKWNYVNYTKTAFWGFKLFTWEKYITIEITD